MWTTGPASKLSKQAETIKIKTLSVLIPVIYLCGRRACTQPKAIKFSLLEQTKEKSSWREAAVAVSIKRPPQALQKHWHPHGNRWWTESVKCVMLGSGQLSLLVSLIMETYSCWRFNKWNQIKSELLIVLNRLSRNQAGCFFFCKLLLRVDYY